MRRGCAVMPGTRRGLATVIYGLALRYSHRTHTSQDCITFPARTGSIRASFKQLLYNLRRFQKFVANRTDSESGLDDSESVTTIWHAKRAGNCILWIGPSIIAPYSHFSRLFHLPCSHMQHSRHFQATTVQCCVDSKICSVQN